MKKRILTALLALCVAFTSVPVDMDVYGQTTEIVETEEAVEDEEQDAEEVIAEQEDTSETSEATTAEQTETSEMTEQPVTETETSEEAEQSVTETETSEEAEQPVTETETSEEAEQSVTETETSEEAEQPVTEMETSEDAEEPETETETSEETEQPATEAEITEEIEQPVTETETSSITEVETDVTEVTETKPVIGTTDLTGNVAGNATVIEDTEATEETEKEEDENIEAELNFILVESDYVATPGTQKVVASVGTEEMELEDLVLTYRNTATKEEFHAKATNKIDDMVLFEMNFEKESQSGTYQLLSITYTLDGKEDTIKLSEQKMDVRFGVNKEVETNPDQLLVEEGTHVEIDADVSASVVTMDEEGNVVSENTVENVLANGIGDIATFGANNNYSTASTSGDLVVVIDAGHDSQHKGARLSSSATEENIVLKIAQYCKTELETYAGVKVYMTRTTESCAFGGNSITSDACVRKRAEYAKNIGANILVSLHLNAFSDSTANGAEVYYPNSNYKQKIGEDGRALAEEIMTKLEALGIRARGIKIRNANVDKYPDGSAADFYGIIKMCKEEGVLGVIVEHAFITCPTDYVNFLNSDEKLKKLGVADAQGIAEAYGLKKKTIAKPVINYTQSCSDGTIKINWNDAGAASYEIYRKEKDGIILSLIGTTSDTSFVDKKVKVGTKYSYQIKALFANNTMESEYMEGCALEKAEISYVRSKSTKKIEIVWGKVKNASGYKVFRKNESTGKYDQVAKIETGKTTSYIDKVKEDNKEYTYKIQAYNVSNGVEGVGAESSTKSGKSLAKPAIKSVAAENEKKIKITWKKVSGADGYLITRSTKKDSGFKKIATITSGKTTSYTDKDVKKNKTYYYKVEAYKDSDGKRGYSGRSSAVKCKTISKTSITSVLSKDSKTLEVKWKKVDGAWGYQIKRKLSTDKSYEVIATVEGENKTTYKDKKVKEGKKYYYKIQVISKVGDTKNYSGDSKAVTGETLKATSITDVKAEGSKKVKLTWKKVSGVTGYQIYRSTSKNGTYEKIATIDKEKTTSYTDKKVKAGKTYYYKVRVYKKNGEKTDVSSYSSKQKAETVKKAEITKISGTSGKKVTIKWKEVSKADGYRISRSTKKSSGYKTIAEIDSADTLKYTDKTVKEGKTYYYKVAALVKGKGDNVGRGDYSSIIEVPVLKSTKISSIEIKENNGLKVKWKATDKADGYQISFSSKKDGEYTSVKKTNSKSYTHKNLNEGTTYYYKVRAYKKLSNGNTVYSAWSSVKSQSTGHKIMGKSNVTVDDMVKYYNARYTYPVDTYKEKGAKDPKEFFKILKEEADAEGVKAEVLFAQVMLETGGLMFGGDVKPEQCNFGGLGATGGGVGGETFEDVRTGLRAQVQHLKAYACSDELKNECVDTRFEYVKRSSAPYIEWLSIPNNPYGTGWAVDNDYASKILYVINKL